MSIPSVIAYNNFCSSISYEVYGGKSIRLKLNYIKRKKRNKCTFKNNIILKLKNS